MPTLFNSRGPRKAKGLIEVMTYINGKIYNFTNTNIMKHDIIITINHQTLENRREIIITLSLLFIITLLLF